MKLIFIVLFMTAISNSYAENNACVNGNCQDGIGTYHYENGDVYVGNWSGGKRTDGEYSWAGGDVYHGTFQEYRNGLSEGKLEMINGDRFEGKFWAHIEGACSFFQEGEYYFSNGDRWEGNYSTGGKRHRKKYVPRGDYLNGTFYFSNGDSFWFTVDEEDVIQTTLSSFGKYRRRDRRVY